MLNIHLTLTVMEILVDFVMAYQFVSLFRYFVKLKLFKLELLDQKLTRQNLFVIIWILVLLLLNAS